MMQDNKKKQYDISLHFDFKEKKDDKKVFSLEKTEKAFAIMQQFSIKQFNTWSNDDIYPVSDDEDTLFANILARKIEETGIQMSSFHFVGSVLECYEESQEKVHRFMDRTLKIFSVCKPRSIVLHPGTFTEGGFTYNKMAHKAAIEAWGEEKTHALLLENLRYFGKKAKEYGIQLAVENIFQGRFYSRIDELVSLVEEVDMPNVGYCLDVGHANVDHVDLPETIKAMGSKLFEVHFHDNNGLKDQHLPIGFGTVDWIQVIKSLQAISYTGSATFEFFRWPYQDVMIGIEHTIRLWETLQQIVENGYSTVEWGDL